MCHRHIVTLSAEDEKDVRKLSGFLIPIYASIVLAMFAVVAVTGTAQRGDRVASTSASTAKTN